MTIEMKIKIVYDNLAWGMIWDWHNSSMDPRSGIRFGLAGMLLN